MGGDRLDEKLKATDFEPDKKGDLKNQNLKQY